MNAPTLTPAGAASLDALVESGLSEGPAAGSKAATLIGLDGDSNWLEGVMLLGVYAILAAAFYFVP